MPLLLDKSEQIKKSLNRKPKIRKHLKSKKKKTRKNSSSRKYKKCSRKSIRRFAFYNQIGQAQDIANIQKQKVPNDICIIPEQTRIGDNKYKEINELTRDEVNQRNIDNRDILLGIIYSWEKNKHEYFQDIDDIDSSISELLDKDLNDYSVWPDDEMSEKCKKKWYTQYDKLFDYLLLDIPKETNIDPPEEIVCPITAKIMNNPQRLKGSLSRQAFEKKAILKWIRENENPTHPLTRELIKEEDLVFADDVYTQIFNFKSLYPYHPDINK